MFKRVLIANRGEIAVRVAATLQQMGVRVVAVYSDVDRASLHVGCADEAYPLEGKTAAETYLRGEKIIDIAKRCGADAVHPGYGFLSENANFAQACSDAGLTFIGPRPEVIRALGDKVNAKAIMAKAGVPTVSGWSGDAKAEAAVFEKEAEKIGYPVLLKAAAGGGGKGMRVVSAKKELAEALEACRREAGAAFGDSRVFMEKYIQRPRHVEFQIFGDSHGGAVHLFERECSVQRRHQKIVEESPSPALTPELRAKMGEAAVKAAKATGYTNAGTVEFLVDDAGGFYFLEVNTRLQVEHPVTEMTLGRDLVRAQLVVAAGGKLPFSQDELQPTGHAIECRIYAEDAARGFLPATGTILRYAPPTSPFVRVDSGVGPMSEVSTYYDPMLAKLIVWGRDRGESLARMDWALRRFAILGITTNVEFLRALVNHPQFRAGHLHTKFLEEHKVAVEPLVPMSDDALVAAALASMNGQARATHEGPTEDHGAVDRPWRTAGSWRTA